MRVELDLSNYATEANSKMQKVLKHQILLKKNDLANLKSDVDKLDFDKLKNVPTDFTKMWSKADKLDVDKLVPVPIDLLKLMLFK